MKKLVFATVSLSMIFFLQAHASEMNINSMNKETIKTISFLSSFSQVNKHNCDGGGSGDIDWSCETEHESSDGELLEFGCKSPTSWACIDTFKETCEERNSGQTTSRSYTQFRGCSSSLGDCW
jgi:hypothetical protein